MKWQMASRRMVKLTERFVGPYKVKGVILMNMVELELPESVRIYLVVNVSKVRRYKEQVVEQKIVPPLPIIIEGKKEYKVERILSKRKLLGLTVWMGNCVWAWLQT